MKGVSVGGVYELGDSIVVVDAAVEWLLLPQKLGKRDEGWKITFQGWDTVRIGPPRFGIIVEMQGITPVGTKTQIFAKAIQRIVRPDDRSRR